MSAGSSTASQGTSAGASAASGGSSAGTTAATATTATSATTSTATGASTGGSTSTAGSTGVSTSTSLGAGTSSTSTTSGAGSTGSSSGWTVTQVLATDAANVAVWDVTTPEDAAPVIQTGDLNGSAPIALERTDTNDLLVLTQGALEVFFGDGGGHAGTLGVAFLSPDPRGGLVFLPQDAGSGVVVLCGGGAVQGFAYPGATAVQDAGYFNPSPLWLGGNDQANFLQCAPGPAGTFFAAAGDRGIFWFDPDGGPHGSGLFATAQGALSGVAMGPGGQVLAVGDDDGGNGFAALYAASGECLFAHSGGACLTACDACVTDTMLGNLPMRQAVSLGNGSFLASIRNQDSELFSSNEILGFDGGLSSGIYYQGPDVGSGGPQFYGLLAWPHGPAAP